jgi:hypothetical protein
MAPHQSSSFDENDLNSVLSNILTRLDQYERTQEKQHTENTTLLQEIKAGFETRIRALEIWRWGLAGGLAVIIAEIGWFIAVKYGH